jgi:hypothetical protein
MPSLDAQAREYYGRAVEAYQAADRDLKSARRPADLERVTQSFEEGRYAMVSTRVLTVSATSAPATAFL